MPASGLEPVTSASGDSRYRRSAPKDPRGIVVNLREEILKDPGSAYQIIPLPSFVALPTVQHPLMSANEVPELSDNGFRPLTRTVPRGAALVEDDAVALKAESEFKLIPDLPRDALITVAVEELRDSLPLEGRDRHGPTPLGYAPACASGAIH